MNRFLKSKIVQHFGSQGKFAEAINKHESLVSRVVRGHVKLKPDRQQEWADLLKTNARKLFEKNNGH